MRPDGSTEPAEQGHAGRLLTEREVADYLAISPETLRRLRYAGEIPYVPLGRRLVRYRREDLDRWLNERTVAAGEGGEDVAAQVDAIFEEIRGRT